MKGIIGRYAEATATLREARRAARAKRNDVAGDAEARAGTAPQDNPASAAVQLSQVDEIPDPASGAVRNDT